MGRGQPVSPRSRGEGQKPPRHHRNLDPVSIDFEAERDSQRAAAQPTLVGHDYSLQGFITYFDPYWIKQIHKFDPGFTPIERRLTYQLPDGGIDLDDPAVCDELSRAVPDAVLGLMQKNAA